MVQALTHTAHVAVGGLLVVPPHVGGGVGPPRQPPPKLDRKVLAPLGRPSPPLDPHREASRVGQRAAFCHILEGGVPRGPRKLI